MTDLNPVSEAAMKLARDAAQGEITLANVEAAADERCRRLFSNVVGEGDVLWDLHKDVCVQAIALGALSASQLGEWRAVMAARESRSK